MKKTHFCWKNGPSVVQSPFLLSNCTVNKNRLTAEVEYGNLFFSQQFNFVLVFFVTWKNQGPQSFFSPDQIICLFWIKKCLWNILSHPVKRKDEKKKKAKDMQPPSPWLTKNSFLKFWTRVSLFSQNIYNEHYFFETPWIRCPSLKILKQCKKIRSLIFPRRSLLSQIVLGSLPNAKNKSVTKGAWK